ncbi:restriction endonuclease subunit S [Gemmiger qucibialis]|jgi:type I restriction enzyme S subunit|uniref:restriction endonuclease subunit S n=1 Tax=Gemmiger qucibialis TaxID=2997294 RepID=UPI0022E75916|nr:restriction endonuclease subunit S [Gemmiger qucibialis]
MREMKDSGIEWIGNVPATWERCKIKNVISSIGSGTTPTSSNIDYYNSEDICWIQSGDLYKTSYISNTAVSLSAKALHLSALQIYAAPFIVVAMYGASVGNIAISTIDACSNQACCCIKPDNNNDLKFMYYWLSMCKIDFLSQSIGGGQPNISQSKIKNQFYYRPQLSEQKVIANFLDSKCSEIDAISADIQKEIEILEQYKRSVITEAVTKGLNPDVEMKDSGIEWVGNIPVHWDVRPLYYYFAERKKKNYLGQEQNLLSLSYGKVIRKDINTSEGLLPDSFNGYNIIEPGDIVLRLTDLQNDKRSLRTGLVKEHGIITSAYVTLKAAKEVVPEYFHYLLYAYDVMKVLYNMGNGVRQGLNYCELSKMHIVAPPLDEQKNIAARLDCVCKGIESIIASKKQQLAIIDSYKKSLIYEYVTGKKEVV